MVSKFIMTMYPKQLKDIDTVASYKKDMDRRKGKGRRFCLGEEFIQFLAALAVLPRTVLKIG